MKNIQLLLTDKISQIRYGVRCETRLFKIIFSLFEIREMHKHANFINISMFILQQLLITKRHLISTNTLKFYTLKCLNISMEDLNCLKENARYASSLFMFICPSRKKIDSSSKDYLII